MRLSAHAKEPLEELALGGDRLVHPCEHVADIAQRVVRVQLDRAWQPARPAARQGGRERAQERRLARMGERGEGFAAEERISGVLSA